MTTELDRLDRELRAAVLDAQCRDWSAERADRVGFARLAQVHWEIENTRGGPRERWWVPAGVLAAGTLTATVILLVAGVAPSTVAVAMGAGVLAGHGVFGAVWAAREWRARRAPTEPAEIDNPWLYAQLTQALESARLDRPDRAEDYERALFWLDAARDELTYRSFPDQPTHTGWDDRNVPR